ncbi:hypothetical protein GCM10010232_46400 [Streptomyces amakusaensis]
MSSPGKYGVKRLAGALGYSKLPSWNRLTGGTDATADAALELTPAPANSRAATAVAAETRNENMRALPETRT